MTRSRYRTDERSQYSDDEDSEQDHEAADYRRARNARSKTEDRSLQRGYGRRSSSSDRSITSQGSRSGYGRTYTYQATLSRDKPRSKEDAKLRYREDVRSRRPRCQTSADAMSEYNARPRHYAPSEQGQRNLKRGTKQSYRPASEMSDALSAISGSTIRPSRSISQRRGSVHYPRSVRSSHSRTTLRSRDSESADALSHLRIFEDYACRRSGKPQFDGIKKKNGQLYRVMPKRPTIRGLTKAEEASILKGRKVQAREKRKSRMAKAVFEGLTGLKVDRR